MQQTQKITCLIVDDEPMALSLMEDYVNKIPFLDLKGKCSNAFQALEKMHDEKIDVLFLDIQMPELNGVELSRSLSKNTRVVFTTAFDQYALDGFKVEALDYLLKPYNFEEFYLAALKAKEWFDLVTLATDNSENKTIGEYLFIRSDYKQLKILLKDILYIEGLKDYVKILLVGEDRPILTHSSWKKNFLQNYLCAFIVLSSSHWIKLKPLNAVKQS
jgi:DNA-binding LytR/AlgR family response regulator